MASGGPAGSHLQKRRVIGIADQNCSAETLRLRMATQAKVGVAFNEHFLIDRAVWVVTNGAAFAHRLVLEYKWPRLIAMTLRATFILSRHRQSARRFENVAAVRVVAIHATHAAFDDRMMLWQTEFGVDIEMALETGCRIAARINDELRAAAGFNVLAAGTVAGFAAGFADHRRIFKMNARVRAGGKFSDDVRVTVRAGFVADVMRTGNFQRHDDRVRRCGTGIQKQQHAAADNGKNGDNQYCSLRFHFQFPVNAKLIDLSRRQP